jgi:hypothetical protein
MSRTTRLLVVAATLATALASGAASAVEPPVFSDVVTVSACVVANPAVPLLAGPGAFSGPVACALPAPNLCALQSDPDISGEIEPASACTLGSINGTYDNIVCGTGDAVGAATIDAPGVGDDYTVDFAIRFVAGQGLFTGVASAPGEEPDTATGVVDLIPTSPIAPPCPATQIRFTATVLFTDPVA